MPRPEDKLNKPMTPEEIEAMNEGTAQVTHKGNGSRWRAWEHNGVFFAKIVEGTLPEGMTTPVRIADQEEFFDIFTSY